MKLPTVNGTVGADELVLTADAAHNMGCNTNNAGLFDYDAEEPVFFNGTGGKTKFDDSTTPTTVAAD